VSVQAPAVVSVNEQLPAPEVSAPEHVTVVALSLAVTVTLPVGVVAPATPATLKATVTDCAVVEGFGVLDVIVVVLLALVTVNVVLVLVTGAKLASPA